MKHAILDQLISTLEFSFNNSYFLSSRFDFSIFICHFSDYIYTNELYKNLSKERYIKDFPTDILGLKADYKDLNYYFELLKYLLADLKLSWFKIWA